MACFCHNPVIVIFLEVPICKLWHVSVMILFVLDCMHIKLRIFEYTKKKERLSFDKVQIYLHGMSLLL